MNQYLASKYGKTLFGFLGFGVPLIFLAAQVFLGWGTLPLMIVMLTWFGFSLLFYMGLTDDEKQ